MKSIDGILFEKRPGYAVCHINELTNEMKQSLRQQLSFICYGRSCSESGKELYNYTNTLKEFLVRYITKPTKTQKGMIGELLSHLIINEYFHDYYVVSPFFNKEERSIKKGFDVVLSSKSDYSIWITEVKSGELHKHKDANDTSNDLVDTAKRDLVDRLNKENRSLWLNAINDAKIAYERHIDLKDSILEILEDYGTKSGTPDSYAGTEMNVFLVSALFAPMSNLVNSSIIQTKASVIKAENLFKGLFIIAIQKATYQKVYEFLKQESEL